MIGALVAGITGSGGASLSSYESIATATATGSQSALTFSSIPSTYKHLQIRGINRTAAGGGVNLTINSDTGANYAQHRLEGNGTTASAAGFASQNNIPVSSNSTAADTMAVSIMDILDYGSTSKYKTFRVFRGFDANGSGSVIITSGLWMNTNAITSITLTNASANNFDSTTTFALYGIKEA